MPRSGKVSTVWENNENKAPECIAARYLIQPLKDIWKIVYLIITDNAATSNFLLKYEKFLREQLLQYKNEVGRILIEAVRSANNLSENSDPSGEDISEWVKLLEMVTEENIED